MSVHDAQPGDVYVDADGKLWRCISICREPTAEFEAVEGYVPVNPALQYAQQITNAYPPTPTIIKERQSGGVDGLMWKGWKRIWRKETAA